MSRPDSSDSNASIERRETKLHIRKGAKDLGIILSSVSNETGRLVCTVDSAYSVNSINRNVTSKSVHNSVLQIL